MPSRPHHYCPRCKEAHGSDCPKREVWEGAGKGRGGRKWRQLRGRVLRRDRYLCQEHLRKGEDIPANEVDHKIPLSRGGTDSLENLESLCKRCHDRKTAQDRHQSHSN